MYAQAVQYTLSRYLTGYVPAAGIIETRLLTNTPEPLTEHEGDGYSQTVDIQFTITQRIARWEA
jgi:hypothetical protein